MTTYTYEYKGIGNETDLEVDHLGDGTIWEIRAWSETFVCFVPVQLRWLEAVMPARLEKVQAKINSIVRDQDFKDSVRYGT